MSVDGPPASGSLPHAPAAPSLVGEVLDGRYRITRKLGEGGMGEVYAAEHVHIEKRFAIKLLRPEIVSNPEAVTRFRQEARSSSSIGHRNIIAIEDFGQLADGRIYMCMELLNGAALNDLITQPQPPDRLLNILIQTGHGLAAAHAKNIVHRDMKPENIFVTIGPNNEDVPKLLDFGIAKVAGNDGQNNLTRTGTIFGTPFYMAPEQALGNPVDARTDIYAMGVIMYEVFTGSLPFQGESFMGILTQHITTEPEPAAQRAAKAGRTLPPGLAEVIARCMQKNPAQRYATMDELVNALIQIYRGFAGAGMSTYMEAFPVSAAHPVVTPAPITGPVAAAAPTWGAPAPTGAITANGKGASNEVAAYPTGAAHAASSSMVAPPRRKTGLILAIVGVLAVAGGIAAVVLLGKGEPQAAEGAQVASADGSGSAALGADGSGSATGPDLGTGSAATAGSDVAGAGSGSSDPISGSGAGSGVAGTAAGSGAELGSNAGSAQVTAPPDASVPEVKQYQVLLFSNASSFEVWEGGAKLFDGPNNLDVPEGGSRTVVLKARGFKDKTVTVEGKKDTRLKVTLSRQPSTSSHDPKPAHTPPPPPADKCTGTRADIRNAACRPKYCAAHADDPLCGME